MALFKRYQPTATTAGLRGQVSKTANFSKTRESGPGSPETRQATVRYFYSLLILMPRINQPIHIRLIRKAMVSGNQKAAAVHVE